MESSVEEVHAVTAFGWAARDQSGILSPFKFSRRSMTGRKLVGGSTIGGLKETQEMIDFATKHNITADTEVISMDYVNTAMERLEKVDVKYQFVIDVANTLKAA